MSRPVCAARGCNRARAEGHLMCRACWQRVPKDLQSAVVRTYAGGRGEGSLAHGRAIVAAVEAAHQAWVEERSVRHIGPQMAAKLDSYFRQSLGYAHALHYCRSYFHWNAPSLAALTFEQAETLMRQLEQEVPAARREMQREQAAREHRQIAGGGVFRG